MPRAPQANNDALVSLFPRASGFYAYSNCVVSFRLSQAAGPEPSSPDSLFGTSVHSILTGGASPIDFDSSVREMATALERSYTQSFHAWEKSLPENARLGALYSERRLYFKRAHFTLLSGQPDRFLASSTHNVYLADFKTSWRPLDSFPASNAQLGVYAALLYDFYKHKIDSLTAAIHKPGSTLPPTIFTRSDLALSAKWVTQIASDSIAPPQNASPRKGPWCRYCWGKVLCPLWHQEVTLLSSFALAQLDALSDQALANLAPRLDLANKIIERLSERLYDRVAKSPASFPGWSIIQGSWRRKISSPAQAYIHLVKNGPLDHDAFLAATRVSISALKSALSTALSLSPQAADNLLEATLTTDGTLARSQSPPTLSYDSDSIQTFQPSPPLQELSQT